MIDTKQWYADMDNEYADFVNEAVKEALAKKAAEDASKAGDTENPPEKKLKKNLAKEKT